VIPVPEQMAQAFDIDLDVVQRCSMLDVQGLEPLHSLLNVADSHRDVKPVKNVRDGVTSSTVSTSPQPVFASSRIVHFMSRSPDRDRSGSCRQIHAGRSQGCPRFLSLSAPKPDFPVENRMFPSVDTMSLPLYEAWSSASLVSYSAAIWFQQRTNG